SFLGFDAISTLAEEVKGDPARQIGRAALIALFIMGGIFIAQTWLATGRFGDLVEGGVRRLEVHPGGEVGGQ
ncbi:hypothetical protein ACV344_34970, partial [Pseudomonas aeruginosa]